MADTVDDILAIPDPGRFAVAIDEHVSWLEGPDGLAGLSQAEQTVYCLGAFEREVLNGGFRLFYTNYAGDHAHATTDALRRVGAGRLAALAERANAAFGPGGPAPEHGARNAQIAALGGAADERWNALDEEFYSELRARPNELPSLVRAYVRAHRAEMRDAP